MSSKREKLLKLIHQVSYKEGEFTLASGKKSKFYIDIKQASLHPEGIQWIGELIADIFLKEFGHAIALGGMTLGADPLVTATQLECLKRGHPIRGFLVRKKTKDYGRNKPVEGIEGIPSNSPVVVLEDTTTTGGSTLTAIEILKDQNLRTVGVISVMDRLEGARENLNSNGIQEYHSLFTLKDLTNGKF